MRLRHLRVSDREDALQNAQLNRPPVFDLKDTWETPVAFDESGFQKRQVEDNGVLRRLEGMGSSVRDRGF